MMKDVIYLAFSDLVYFRFENITEGMMLKDIIKLGNNLNSKTKIMWNKVYKDYVGNWTLIRIFNSNDLNKKLNLEEKQFYAIAFQSPDKKNIIISYRGTDGDNGSHDWGKKLFLLFDIDPDFLGEHLVTNSKIALSIPGRQFELAETFYNSVINRLEDKTTTISFTGHSLGGGLAQYASVMASLKRRYDEPVMTSPDSDIYITYKDDVKHTVTWSGIGIKSFSKITGYEFLDSGEGLFGNLDGTLQRVKDRLTTEIFNKKIRTFSDKILDYFSELGYIKNGTIMKAFLDSTNEVDIDKLEKAVDNFRLKYAGTYEGSILEDIIGSHFDDYGCIDSYKNIKRKLDIKKRFKTCYGDGDKFKGHVINYKNTYDLTPNLADHIGDTYTVDQSLNKKDSGNFLPYLPQNKTEFASQHGLELYYPYILAEENGNGKSAKNIHHELAEIGDITTRLSEKYLQAELSKIIDYIDEKVPSFKNRLFKFSRVNQDLNVITILIKTFMIRSMKLQNRTDINMEDYIDKNISDHILSESEKMEVFQGKFNFRLDNSILNHLNTNYFCTELRKLWDWRITSTSISLVIGEIDEHKFWDDII